MTEVDTATGGGRGDYDTSSPVASFFATVRAVMVKPWEFFGALPREGGARAPVWFAVAAAVVLLVCGGFYSLIGAAIEGGGVAGVSYGSVVLGVVLVAVFIVLYPLLVVAGLYVGAALLHLLVMIFVGSSRAPFEATLRVVSYGSTASLLSWVPVLRLAAGAYNAYLSYTGVRRLHGAPPARAAPVALIPLLVSWGLGAIAVLTAADPAGAAWANFLAGGFPGAASSGSF